MTSTAVFGASHLHMVIDIPTSGIALPLVAIAKEKNKVMIATTAGTSDLSGKACTPNSLHWTWDTWSNSHATRAAVEEGIVPGGGVALLRASQHLKGLRTKNDDQKTGVEIVRKALSWPARQIAINAGEDGSVIVGKILEKDQYNYGFDSQTGEYVNLISTGIIDPTKVVRVAIQNAASVAALLITTEAMTILSNS